MCKKSGRQLKLDKHVAKWQGRPDHNTEISRLLAC